MLHRILSSLGIVACSLTFFIPAVRAQCSPTPNGLVAWYKGDGDANDSSGNGYHGTMGDAGIGPGLVGQAFNFTAQNQSVVIPNNPALFPLTALTIEGWVNPLDYAGCSVAYRTFHTVQFEPLRGYAPFINCSNQKFVGALFDSAGTVEAVVSNASIPAGTFTHFAMTWDGMNLRIYINGVLDNTVTTAISAIGTNANALRIGNSQALGFRGQIDEITLYNRALLDAQVAAIFSAGAAGKCFPPTAAAVSIGGRAIRSNGIPILAARITLQDQAGNIRTALTNPFGYYRFDDLAAGETVMLTAAAKGQQFIQPKRVITVHESVANVDFVTVE